MPKKSRRKSAARQSRKRWLGLIGIALFLAVDIVLVALALQSTSPRDNGSAAEASDPIASPSSTPSATPTPSETDETVLPLAPTRILTALDATVAWRATTGPCPDASATPEITADGGSTWTTADLTAATGLVGLQRIDVSDATTATFLGADEGCAPDAARTFVAGADFAESPNELEASWHLVSGDTVHAPGGDVASPCASPLSLAPADDTRAAVLCGDGTAHLTTDAGVSWAPLDTPPGTIALTATDDGVLAASAGSVDCGGVQLTAIDVDGSGVTLGCVESSRAAPELAGSTAIDWGDDSIWMWVDDRLLISTDEGETWA